MNIVFIHTAFPGHFKFLAEHFGRDKSCQTLFITSPAAAGSGDIPGVKKLVYPNTPPAKEGSEDKDLPRIPPGLSVANLLADLKKKKVTPHLIVAQAGSGTSFYVKDIFPDTPLLCHFEWFHNPKALLTDFRDLPQPDINARMNMRNKNIAILNDLAACDTGICPSKWQLAQFPEEFQKKLRMIPHAVDTAFFSPKEPAGFKTKDLDLSGCRQLVTYTAGLLAPYPGFQQFVESLPKVLEKKPDAHVVIAAADRVSLGRKDEAKQSFKSMILEKVSLDPKRVHFIDRFSREDYRSLLRASAVHVYVDTPLVTAGTLMEAMACGCLVVAPDTPPVKEFIKDGTQGVLTDFSLAQKIGEKIINCLDFPSFTSKIRENARQRVLERSAMDRILPQQLDLIKKMVSKKAPSNRFG